MSEKMITIHGYTIKGAIEMPLAELKRVIAEAEASQVPTFQVGEWVALEDLAGIGKVAEAVGVSKDYPDCVGVMWHDRKHDLPNHYYPHQLRHATPEEIAAATRIAPKVGMLLKRKSDGAVFRVYQVSHMPGIAHVEQLTDVPCGETFQVQLLRGVSTEDYEVLDSFTVQGVR